MSWFTESRDKIRNKGRAITKKVADLKPKIISALGGSINLSLSADIDAAIKVILDDSFLKVIDRAVVALDSTIDKTSQELQQLVQQIFDNLSDLEKQLGQLIDQFFQNLSDTIKDIRKNLVDPLLDAISDLEKKIFEDVNQVLDKIFDYFDGKAEEFKQDLLKIFGWFALPNPLDPCRQKYQLELTPGNQLTYIDVFNLVECHQMKRLEDNPTTVKEIKEVYANLQLQSFKMTCLGRGSPGFQKIYMQKWLDYGQLFEIWNRFMDTMTHQQAYDEAIKRLNQARDEYQARVADINAAQQTANDAVNRANNAQNIANEAHQRADTAQTTANGAVKGIDFFIVEAAVDTTVQSNDVVINFPDSVDAVALHAISNDSNQIIRAPLSPLNPTSFKVHFDGVNGNGHRWIPGMQFLGIKVRR
jgi:ABC-type transporter Mla subunit MlaD